MANKTYQIAFQLGAKVQASMGKAFSTAQKNIGGINKNLKQVQKSAQNANRSIGKLGSGLKSVAKAAVGLGSAYLGFNSVKGFLGSAIESASSLEGYRNTLNVVMKDQAKASKAMTWAVNFANRTPFETDSIVEATVRLQSYGLEAQKILPSIGNMAGVMNKDIMQAVEAVADAQTGELERLKEFGITKAMISQKASEMYRNQEIVNNKGQIVDQQKFNNALMAIMNERFKGGMELQANSFKGIMSTISGAWKNGLAKMAGVSGTGEIIKGGLFDAVKVKAKGLSNFLVTMSNNGSFEKIGLMLGKGFSSASNAIGFVAKKAGVLKGIFNSVGKNVMPIVNLLEGEYKNAFANRLKLIKNTIPQVMDAFKKVSPYTKQFAESLKGGLIKIIPVVGKFIKSIDGFIIKLMPIFLNVFGYISMNVLPLFGDAFGFIAALIPPLVMAFSKWLPHIASIIQNLWIAIQSILDTIVGYIQFYLPFIKAIVSTTITHIITVVGGIIGVLDGIIQFIAGVFTGDWSRVWEGVKQIFVSIFSTFGELAKKPINGVLSIINGAIRSINKVNIKIPDWVPGLGGQNFGINIPLFPMLAKGTNNFGGGMAIVGEQGPELVNLPRHSKVIPNRRTSSILGRLRQGTSSTTVKNQSNNETVHITYAPQYIIQGNPDKKDLESAAKRSEEGFEKKMDDYFARRKRLKFNPEPV